MVRSVLVRPMIAMRDTAAVLVDIYLRVLAKSPLDATYSRLIARHGFP